MPDLSILFDLDPKIGLQRINSNEHREINRLDLEKIDFHKRVRLGYNVVYENNKDRIIKIDAKQSKENVIKQIKDILKSRIWTNIN